MIIEKKLLVLSDNKERILTETTKTATLVWFFIVKGSNWPIKVAQKKKNWPINKLLKEKKTKRVRSSQLG